MNFMKIVKNEKKKLYLNSLFNNKFKYNKEYEYDKIIKEKPD